MELKKSEIKERIARFYDAMNEQFPDWDAALIVNNVNQYYFTGTIQDGILVFQKSGDYKYFVRRSYVAALKFSLLDKENIVEMNSYKDVAALLGANFSNCYIEEDVMPYAMLSRIKKYVNIEKVGSLDALVKNLRSVKSQYELECMRICGETHNRLMTDIIPKIVQEGMSEVDFFVETKREMYRFGYHGISRFSAFQTESFCGQFSFGDSNLLTSLFNGPSGNNPDQAYMPTLFSRKRKLKKGDLVFADIAFGQYGYHTDKTQIYVYKGTLSSSITDTHNECLKILSDVSSQLKAGAIPSKIYSGTIASLSDEFKVNFMGNGKGAVKFVGHGIGLVVDEFPVIAKGFDSPLKENMTLALEPKKAMPDIGLVGVEETYIVTKDGGECITGGAKEIISIK